MSLDLEIKMSQAVKADQLLNAVSKAFTQLLQLEAHNAPVILIEKVEDGGIRHLIDVEWINAPVFLVISIQGLHSVELMVIRYADVLKEAFDGQLNEDELSPEDFEMVAEVAVRGTWHNPDSLKWVLGAACAIGLAREAKSSIVDASQHWNTVYEQDAESFFLAIQNQKAHVLAEANLAVHEISSNKD